MTDPRVTEEVCREYRKLLNQGRLAEAIPLIRQAANWADQDSQNLLREIFLHGAYGHARSAKAGFEYARLAAMNENAAAMNDLADLYETGEGCSKDLQKAFYWRKKAAELDEADAFDPLGMMYLQGRVIQRDLHQARRWFEQAAKNKPDELVSRHLQMLEKLEEKTS